MFSLLRRAVSVVLTFITLGVAGVVGYTYANNWLSSDPVILEMQDGRPTLSAVQPAISGSSIAANSVGLDISYPQCKLTQASKLPTKDLAFGIVGLNRGKPFTENPCFAKQWQWASALPAAAIYINTADPNKGDPTKYGLKIARDTIKRLAKFDVAKGTPVWLDVETLNTWTTPERSNLVLAAALQAIADAGYPVGIYAPPAHWFEITLNAKVEVPTWLALGNYSSLKKGLADAKAACKVAAFGDQVPKMVQFVTKRSGQKYDHNLLCVQSAGLVLTN